MRIKNSSSLFFIFISLPYYPAINCFATLLEPRTPLTYLITILILSSIGSMVKRWRKYLGNYLVGIRIYSDLYYLP